MEETFLFLTMSKFYPPDFIDEWSIIPFQLKFQENYSPMEGSYFGKAVDAGVHFELIVTSYRFPIWKMRINAIQLLHPFHKNITWKVYLPAAEDLQAEPQMTYCENLKITDFWETILHLFNEKKLLFLKRTRNTY